MEQKNIKNLMINYKNKNINEGFSNLFDSSTVDYAEHFEKSDIDYIKRKEIKEWMDTYTTSCLMSNTEKDPLYYTINSDYTIDINELGCLLYCYPDLDPIETIGFINGALPEYIKFNKCEGDFVVSRFKENLKSLKGFPKYVEGDFDVSFNDLSDLIGGPEIVGGDYYVNGNKKISNILKDNGGFPDNWIKNYKVLHEKYGFPTFNCDAHLYGGISNFIFSDNNYSNLQLTVKKSVIIKEYIKSNQDYATKLEVNESFNNILDSSIIDYASNFEKKDIEYKKNKILDWIKNNIVVCARVIGFCFWNESETGIKGKSHNDRFLSFFKINDDYTIDIINPYINDFKNNNIIIQFFPRELSSILNQKTNIFGKGYLELIPDYIQFNKCDGSFKLINFPEFKSLRGLPKIINGNLYINDLGIRTLEGCPEIVSGIITIKDCHELVNFKGAPKICSEFKWYDYKSEYTPATDAVFPKYNENNMLINGDEL